MEPTITISESRVTRGQTTTVSVSGPVSARGELTARVARVIEALAPESGRDLTLEPETEPAPERWLADAERWGHEADRPRWGEPCANPDPEERVS